MSDASYQKDCLYCKNKITMSKESGSWLPYELNSDKKHDCRKKQEPATQQEAKNGNGNGNGNNGNNKQADLSLELVIKKLESIGVSLDLEKLRNATNGATK